MPKNEKSDKKLKFKLGLIGCILGFLAMTAAFFSPWIAAAIDPPGATFEETVSGIAETIRSAVSNETEKTVNINEASLLPSAYLTPGIISLGMVASGFGVVSLLTREQIRFSVAAFSLGIIAALVQWSILIASAIIALLLVIAVFQAFGEHVFDVIDV